MSKSKIKPPVILDNLNHLLGIKFPVQKIVEKIGIYTSISIILEDMYAAEEIIRKETQAKIIQIMDHHNARSCSLDSFLFGRLNIIINDEGVIIKAYYDIF